MPTIFHFFDDLCQKRSHFRTKSPLKQFPFNESLLYPDVTSAEKESGSFPDRILRAEATAPGDGGELIEFKDSQSYVIASFNSTIPAGQKDLNTLFSSNSTRLLSLISAGENLKNHSMRDVFYLIRGKSGDHLKVCLVHGSFFETIDSESLIREAFVQALTEALGQPPDNDLLAQLTILFSKQKYFSKTRKIANASVSLRFRVMTQAVTEGNLLNTKQYPEIKDDTLTLVLPQTYASRSLGELPSIMNASTWQMLTHLTIQHRLNGPFLGLQIPL